MPALKPFSRALMLLGALLAFSSSGCEFAPPSGVFECAGGEPGECPRNYICLEGLCVDPADVPEVPVTRECPEILAPEDGWLLDEGPFAVGDEARFECDEDEGFTLEGDPILSCLESGEWSGTPPRCVIPGTCPPGEQPSQYERPDPVCEPCPEESFSSSHDREACEPWRLCSNEAIEDSPPSAAADRVCLAPSVRQFGSHDSDIAYDVAISPEREVVVVGYTAGILPGQSGSSNHDGFIRKYSAAGDVAWTRQLTASNGTAPRVVYVRAVDIASDGSIVIAGFIGASLSGGPTLGGHDAFARKYDADGEIVWTHEFGSSGDDSALALAIAEDGSIVVGGLVSGIISDQATYFGEGDGFIRTLNADGSERWTRQFGTPSFEQVQALALAPDGSIYVTGLTAGALPGQEKTNYTDIFIQKYDASGEALWTHQFGGAGGTSTVTGYSLSVGADGAVYLGGWVSGVLPGQTNYGGRDAFIRRYDPSDGNPLWTRQFGRAADDVVYGSAVGEDGSIYITGYTTGYRVEGDPDSPWGADLFVRRYSSSGELLWEHAFGTDAADRAYALARAPDGTLAIAGETLGSLLSGVQHGYEDAFVVVYSPEGAP